MSRKNKRDNSQKITARRKWDAIHDTVPSDLKDLIKEINNKKGDDINGK